MDRVQRFQLIADECSHGGESEKEHNVPNTEMDDLGLVRDHLSYSIV